MVVERERACEYAAIRIRRGDGRDAQQKRDSTVPASPPSRGSHEPPIHTATRRSAGQEKAATPNTISSPAAPTPGHVASIAASSHHSEHNFTPPGGADPDGPVNVLHLRLILHFSLATAVPEIPDHLTKVGSELVVRVSLETPYLLYQVLAISARHLAYLHPEHYKNYYGQAVQLQTHAIAAFNASQPLDSDACVPAVLFSSILSRHSLTDTLSTRDGDFPAFVDRFVQCAQLQRGIRAVVSGVSWSSLLQSDLSPFLKWGVSGSHITTHGHECDQLLRLVAITTGLDPVSRESCRTAIHHLQAGLDELANPVPETNSFQLIFSWNIYLHEEFLTLLAQQRPEAAAIMGWYAVLLHRGRHLWQIGDAGAFILASVTEFLGLDWVHWLEWPRSVITGHSGLSY